MAVLLRDFGLHRNHFSAIPADLNLVQMCGELRQQGYNVEETVMILLTTLLRLRIDFPDTFGVLPINAMAWLDKATEWLGSKLVGHAGHLHFQAHIVEFIRSCEPPVMKILPWAEVDHVIRPSSHKVKSLPDTPDHPQS